LSLDVKGSFSTIIHEKLSLCVAFGKIVKEKKKRKTIEGYNPKE
jgi:hypothetical protein